MPRYDFKDIATKISLKSKPKSDITIKLDDEDYLGKSINTNFAQDNKYYIKVLIKSAAKDYVVDKNNLEYRYGINNQMIEKNNYLTFSKVISNAKDNWLLEKIVSN